MRRLSLLLAVAVGLVLGLGCGGGGTSDDPREALAETAAKWAVPRPTASAHALTPSRRRTTC